MGEGRRGGPALRARREHVTPVLAARDGDHVVARTPPLRRHGLVLGVRVRVRVRQGEGTLTLTLTLALTLALSLTLILSLTLTLTVACSERGTARKRCSSAMAARYASLCTGAPGEG